MASTGSKISAQASKAKTTGQAAQRPFERSNATDDDWRRKQLKSSGSDTSTSSVTSSTTSNPDTPLELMHGYGDSWFENLSVLGMEYHRQKADKKSKSNASPNGTTPAMHGYGDAWFENLNHQREDFEHRKSEELERQSHQMHNYGSAWFEHYEGDWEEWKHVHSGKSS